MVTLVDLPDLGPEVVRPGAARPRGARTALARAAYDGVPGHPVLLGRDHWPGVLDVRDGDQGARAYLARPRRRSSSSAATSPPAATSTPDLQPVGPTIGQRRHK